MARICTEKSVFSPVVYEDTVSTQATAPMELVTNKELNLHIRPDGSTKYNAEADFRFVIIERFLSVENEFALREGLLLNAYFFLKHLGQSDEAAFGLDKNDVEVEHVPLVYHRAHDVSLSRKSYQNLDPDLK